MEAHTCSEKDLRNAALKKPKSFLGLTINKFSSSKHVKNVISKVTKAVNEVEELGSVLRGITGQIMKHLYGFCVSSIIQYTYTPVRYSIKAYKRFTETNLTKFKICFKKSPRRLYVNDNLSPTMRLRNFTF